MFALLLTYSDDPARLEHRPQHKERMQALAAEGAVLASGPWADDSGALIVFLLDSREEVQAIVDADPYLTAPGVTAELQEWSAGTRHPAVRDL